MGAFEERATPDELFDERAAGPYDEIGRVLADLPRPRRIRMSRRGKSTAVLVAAVLMASMGIFIAGLAAKSSAQSNAGPSQSLPFALPIVFVVVIVPLMLRQITRQKPLLTDGEIAMARVTKRRAARHGPTIRYEFRTPLGEQFSRGASDGSGRLSVGMSVPVFYDPRNPKRQLALCGSFYEVMLPGEE